VTLKDRARVIAALESVDAVTWFGENTPVKLIERLQPKIYVKGGDYDVTKIPEYPIVRTYGGKALALQFVKGRSTTKLIKKARERT
jgi:rfaE bifunctional protein nucleotidyltransferase chain/domain